MSGVKLGGRESDLTIPECGLAIMRQRLRRACFYHEHAPRHLPRAQIMIGSRAHYCMYSLCAQVRPSYISSICPTVHTSRFSAVPPVPYGCALALALETVGKSAQPHAMKMRLGGRFGSRIRGLWPLSECGLYQSVQLADVILLCLDPPTHRT